MKLCFVLDEGHPLLKRSNAKWLSFNQTQRKLSRSSLPSNIEVLMMAMRAPLNLTYGLRCLQL
jgi:hypothetical protein